MSTLCWVLAAFLAICATQLIPQPSTTPEVPICITPSENGIIDEGCWGYRECVKNVTVTHLCPEGQVLKKPERRCVPKGQSFGECDFTANCTNEADAMYANLTDNCRSYFRCLGGIDIGAFYCPANLRFSYDIQGCDFEYNLLPPCGTKDIVGR